MSADAVGIFVDREWFISYEDNPPPEALHRINGATPLSRVEGLRQRWQTETRSKQRAGYEVLRERTEAEIADADETLDLIPKKLDEWLKGLRSGTLDPEQVMQNIAELAPVQQEIQRIYSEATASADAAAEMIDQSPEAYSQQQVQRFNSLARSGPYVTEAWLRGEPGAPDPLGRDRS